MIDTKKYIKEKLGWEEDLDTQLERIGQLREKGFSIPQIAKMALEGKIPLDTSQKKL